MPMPHRCSLACLRACVQRRQRHSAALSVFLARQQVRPARHPLPCLHCAVRTERLVSAMSLIGACVHRIPHRMPHCCCWQPWSATLALTEGRPVDGGHTQPRPAEATGAHHAMHVCVLLRSLLCVSLSLLCAAHSTAPTCRSARRSATIGLWRSSRCDCKRSKPSCTTPVSC